MSGPKFRKVNSGPWSVTARNVPSFIYLNLIFIYYGRLLCNNTVLATWPSPVNKSCSVMCKRLSAESRDKGWICNHHPSQRTFACLGSAWLLQMDWLKLKIENEALKMVSWLYGGKVLPCCASLWPHFLKVPRQFNYKVQKFLHQLIFMA